ncbi:MAG: nucleoside hydrolase [Clostridia bacterium]
MNIGIDIDNVISNFNEMLLDEFLIHDKKLGNKGIKNKNADYITRGMFYWEEDEVKSFYDNNIESIAKKLKVKSGAKKYIDRLKKEGHIIYIITSRDNGEYSDSYKMTKEWLDTNLIYYDKLILTNAYKNDKHGKTKNCIENNIDIMIDDSIHICQDCIDNNITTILMNTPYNKKVNILRAYSWKEVYEFICNYNSKKINVILDTDTFNECDDQFALTYMLKSQDIFNIEAITIAPYSHNSKRKVSVLDGQEKSYNEVLKICNWLNFNTTNKVFKGSIEYIQNGYNVENDAVRKIIEIALKNDRTCIMAIGAITNVALAIKTEPKIIDKIEIIWLGGNEINYENNLEYNFIQDIEAVKVVFNSKVKITIIPCKEIASILKTNIDTLNKNMNNNILNKYLKNKFYNDGYHEIQESRVIWDISVIACVIDKTWFEIKQISCPNIKDDTSYEITENKHNILFVTKMNKEYIYNDLFKKLMKE